MLRKDKDKKDKIVRFIHLFVDSCPLLYLFDPPEGLTPQFGNHCCILTSTVCLYSKTLIHEYIIGSVVNHIHVLRKQYLVLSGS